MQGSHGGEVLLFVCRVVVVFDFCISELVEVALYCFDKWLSFWWLTFVLSSLQRRSSEHRVFITFAECLPGRPEECFLEVFGYLKPTKKHSFGCLGILLLLCFQSFLLVPRKPTSFSWSCPRTHNPRNEEC